MDPSDMVCLRANNVRYANSFTYTQVRPWIILKPCGSTSMSVHEELVYICRRTLPVSRLSWSSNGRVPLATCHRPCTRASTLAAGLCSACGPSPPWPPSTLLRTT